MRKILPEETIKIFGYVGSFAENKDTAQRLRVECILPMLNENKNIILDFTGVETMTQSFTHALISDLIRKYNHEFFDRISFKNCDPTVKRVIKIVTEYMQRSYKSEKVK